MNLKEMSDDDILNLRETTTKSYQRNSSQAHREANLLKKIKHELRLRRLNRDGLPLVSDHALLRYLQRVKGVDVESTRDEIQTRMPTIGKGKNWKDIDCINLDGVRYYLSQDKRCITTVMTDKENSDENITQIEKEKE